MVVLQTNVVLFQVMSRFPKWSSFTGDGSGCGGGSRVGKQFHGCGIDRFRDRGQRLERFQKIFFQSRRVDSHTQLTIRP